MRPYKRCFFGNSNQLPCPAQVSLGNYNTKQYCDNIQLSSLTPVQTSGAYHKFSIPISSFHCSIGQSSLSQLGFQNVNGQAASFCLDDVAIAGGGSNSNSNSGGGATGARRL
jgi:hypothetical protein